MDRRFLVAKRRQNRIPENNANALQLQCNSRSNANPVWGPTQSSPPRIGKDGSTKNIASARMKRLRESLAIDLNATQNSDDNPPAKRFAPDSSSKMPVTQDARSTFVRPYEEQRVARTPPRQEQRAVSSTPRSPSCKSPRKSFIPETSMSRHSSPRQLRQSMNRRLRDAVTSTPEHKKYSKSLDNSESNSSFAPLGIHDNTASTSGIGLLNDEDANITDLSGSIKNYSSNLYLSSTSNVSLFCNANDSSRDDDLENMDWSPVSEQQMLSNIREARDSMYEVQIQQPLAFNCSTTSSSIASMNAANIYIIVDTNIFIDKLQTVINIMHITYADDSQPVIYVPWMVIQELDYFKDGYSLSDKHPISKIIQTRCRKAVKFINECLIARKQNFKGQPVQRAAENRLKGQNADDSILACCVQLFSEGYDVVLLSSDTNLRNKAMISNIRALAPSEIMQDLKKKTLKKRFNFVEEISKKLALICSFMLHFEIKAHYGEHEYTKKAFKDLPWQFRDCVKYLSDHFDPVFRAHVPKQCRKVVDDLHELLFVNEAIVNEVKFTELCLSLLIYFQTGLPKYEANIQNTIQEVKQLENEFFV